MKIFSINQYPFSTKVILAFLIFLLVFMLIRTSLSIPKIEKQALSNEIEYISKSLLLLQEQLKIIGKSLKMQRKLETELLKLKIEKEIKTLDRESDILGSLDKSGIFEYCSCKLSSDDLNIKKIKKDDYFAFNDINILNRWQKYKVQGKNQKNHKGKTYYFYNYMIEDILLSAACSSKDLNPGHITFEKDLKKHIHSDLIIDSSLSDTKSAFVWINPDLDKNDQSVLHEKKEENRRDKYNVSMLSNIRDIPTGSLTVKEVLDASKKSDPVMHTIEGKEVLTWVINLINNQKKSFFIIYTIDKKSLENKNKAKLLFLLPESLIAIGISFILLFVLLRRILKNIDTLTKTAMLVNEGKKHVRSKVKGDDDIGVLGKSFDSMLDLFENSIETLDKKVEEKTKEISKSLEEKEILLKEVHHRVKNNLSLTISLIELQEEEINDEKTKKVLVDIQERIYTMELLHRKLYESENLNEIPFKTYVVDLIEAIAKTYDTQKKVDLDIEMEPMNLNIETAMPYGLILNELATNAFKYAFGDQKEFRLYINISVLASGEIKIVIQDNGKGLKKDFSKICNETLGLKLINMIVTFQLDGSIDYEYDNGAKFTIQGKI